jgi:hypothetical protein
LYSKGVRAQARFAGASALPITGAFREGGRAVLVRKAPLEVFF